MLIFFEMSPYFIVRLGLEIHKIPDKFQKIRVWMGVATSVKDPCFTKWNRTLSAKNTSRDFGKNEKGNFEAEMSSIRLLSDFSERRSGWVHFWLFDGFQKNFSDAFQNFQFFNFQAFLFGHSEKTGSNSTEPVAISYRKKEKMFRFFFTLLAPEKPKESKPKEGLVGGYL